MSKHLSKDLRNWNFTWKRSQQNKNYRKYILNTKHWDGIIRNKFTINRNQHFLHSHTIIIKTIYMNANILEYVNTKSILLELQKKNLLIQLWTIHPCIIDSSLFTLAIKATINAMIVPICGFQIATLRFEVLSLKRGFQVIMIKFVLNYVGGITQFLCHTFFFLYSMQHMSPY